MGEAHSVLRQPVEIGAGEAWIAEAMNLVGPKLVERNQNDVHRRTGLAAQMARHQAHRDCGDGADKNPMAE